MDFRKRAGDSKARLASSSQKGVVYPSRSHGLPRSPLFEASRRLQLGLGTSEGHPQAPSATVGRRDGRALLPLAAQNMGGG